MVLVHGYHFVDCLLIVFSPHIHYHMAGKFRVQNIVADLGPAATGQLPSNIPGPVQSAWDNHLATFLAQDRQGVLKDYNDSSVLHVFDFKTNLGRVFTGLDEIGSAFEQLWGYVGDSSCVGGKTFQM